MLAGEVHALLVRKVTAGDNGASYFSTNYLVNVKDNKTVVEKYSVTCDKLIGKTLIRNRNAPLITDYILGRKGEAVAVGKCDLFVFKSSYSIFRSLCVKHYRNRHIKLFSYSLDQLDLCLVLLVRSVREVESCDVHSRAAHLGQRFFIFRCRTYRAYDFGLAHKYVLPIRVRRNFSLYSVSQNF